MSASSQLSTSEGDVRMTGMALAWIGATIALAWASVIAAGFSLRLAAGMTRRWACVLFAAGAPDLAADQILRPFDDDARVVAAGRSRPHGVRHGSEHRLHVAGRGFPASQDQIVC